MTYEVKTKTDRMGGRGLNESDDQNEFSLPQLQRNPLLVALAMFVTLGLYGIVWWYLANRDLRDLGRRLGVSELEVEPWKAALAISAGLPLIVPAVVTLTRTCQRIKIAEQHAGVTYGGPTNMPFKVAKACALCVMFPPAGFAHLQVTLNRIWLHEVGIPDGAGSTTIRFTR